MTTAQDGGKVVSLTDRPAFSPRKYTWYSFLLTLAKYNFEIPWEWYKYIETCRSDYIINIVKINKYVYIVLC